MRALPVESGGRASTAALSMSQSDRFGRMNSSATSQTSGHPDFTVQPRLMNATQLAAYLGYASTAVLRNFPVAPIQLCLVGVGRGRRWDRFEVDAYLDNRSGRNSLAGSCLQDDSADAALERWVNDNRHSA